jgi:hypothetical protein
MVSRRSSHREASSSGPSAPQDSAASSNAAAQSPKPSLPPQKVGPASIAIDLGSYSIRICIANSSSNTPIITECPNAIVRSSQKKHSSSTSGPLAGPQILEKCRNFGSLSIRQPMDRGMIVDWPTQKTILDLALADAVSREKGARKSGERLLEGRDVIVTEAYFNVPELQAALDLLFLEEYGAARIWRCNRESHLIEMTATVQRKSSSREPFCGSGPFDPIPVYTFLKSISRVYTQEAASQARMLLHHRSRPQCDTCGPSTWRCHPLELG